MEECGGYGRAYRAQASWAARQAGGGTGNPGGYGASHTSGSKSQLGNNAEYKGKDGTGGLLIMYTNQYNNKGTIESNGTESTDTISPVGGASGAGSINIFYNEFIANNTCIAKGGESKCYGGEGGNGSITIGNISTGTFQNYENISND